MPFKQLTAAQQFANYVTADMASAAAQALVSVYTNCRATVLGLVQGRMGPQNQVVPYKQFPTLKLKDRLAALGADFGTLMQQNAELKAYVEKVVNKCVSDLGGVSAIDPAGAWSWLLVKDQTQNLIYFPDGTDFALPGLPFDTMVGGTDYTVNITVDPNTGIGTATFTAQGATANTDPM